MVFSSETAAVEDVEKFCKKTMDILKYQLPPTSAKIRKGTKVRNFTSFIQILIEEFIVFTTLKLLLSPH